MLVATRRSGFISVRKRSSGGRKSGEDARSDWICSGQWGWDAIRGEWKQIKAKVNPVLHRDHNNNNIVSHCNMMSYIDRIPVREKERR